MKDFTQSDFTAIMERERILRHDVKAIEYFIKDLTEIRATGKSHLIHVGLTSQDACSLGFALCMRDATLVILNRLTVLENTISQQLMNPATANIYMLGYTHGQPATPTNFLKEMAVYHTRLFKLHQRIKKILAERMTVKFGGATGEFNAMKFCCPDIEWTTWCNEFVTEFNTPDCRFNRTLFTNQCDNYDSIVELLFAIKAYLLIMEHLRGNLWLYIHRGYLIQETIASEIGSSTMPNKVNPIDLENAKTAIELGKRMIDGVVDVLNETSFQRDVSDSSALRNISAVYGYVLIAVEKMINGVKRLMPNASVIKEELEAHPEVILEGIQTYLKFHCGVENAYELAKGISRGKQISLPDIRGFIDGLDIADEHKVKLKMLEPSNYIGTFAIKS
jgi:adenylosuccinate lyase